MAFDVKVQEVSYTLTSAETTKDVTIPATLSSLANAFLYVPFSLPSAGVGRESSSASSDPQYWGVTAELINTTTVRFTRQAATTNESCACKVFVVEYIGTAGGPNEFIVRHRETVQMGSGGSSKNSSAISGISSLAKCVPFGSVRANTSGLTVPQVFCELNVEFSSPNNVCIARRSSTGAGQPYISMEVVEFTGSNWEIQQIAEITPSADDTSDNTTITAVPALTAAWIHRFVKPHSSGNAPDDITGYAYLSSTTNLVTRMKDTGSASRLRVFVIANAEMTVQTQGTLDGTDDWTAGSSPQTQNLTITAVDLTASIPSIQAGSSGTASTDHPAAHWRADFASTTSFEAFRGKSTGGSEYIAQAIQFPATAAAATTPVSITSVTSPLVRGDVATIVATGMKATQGIGSVTIGGVDVTESGWSDTGCTFTVPSTVLNGIRDVVVTNSDGEQDTYAVQVNPPANTTSVTLAGTLVPAGNRVSGDVDVVVGNQIEYHTPTNCILAGCYVDPTGWASCDPTNEALDCSFQYRILDGTGPGTSDTITFKTSTFGTPATQYPRSQRRSRIRRTLNLGR